MGDSAPAELRRQALGLTAVWALLGLLRLMTHEMWRDELQAWTIARASETPLQLISNLRYEGHPGLWALCLFLVSRITDSPVGMQLFNLAVGSATAFLLFRFAPFRWWVTVSIAFGYFVAYEYGTLSRSYGLGMLCIFWFCAVYSGSHRRRLLMMGLALSMLALTSIYGVIAAAGLAAGALWDLWVHRPAPGPGRRRRTVTFAAVVALGMVVTVYFVRQPADAGFDITPRIRLDANVGLHTLGSVWRGLVPVPPLRRQFWNRDVLEPAPFVRAAAGIALFAAALSLLRGSRAALLAFTVGGTGLLAFSYLIYTGGIRHDGHHFLMLTATCWMAAANMSGTIRPAWGPLLGGLAILQFAIGTFASVMDFRFTFSGSRDTASYIRMHYPPDVPIVADPELPGVPIAAWLERDVFFPQSNRFGSFVVWNKQRLAPDLDRAVAAADRLSTGTGRDVLLLTTRAQQPPARFRHVGHFAGTIVPEETYEVYLLEAVSAAAH
jgi:hypothetical protein